MSKARIELPPKIAELFAEPLRYRAAYGGRGSGKTRSFAKMAAVYGYMYGKNNRDGVILCAREHLNSLEDSSFREISSAIQSEPFLEHYYDIGENYIKSRDGRIRFIFAGLRRNVDSIKSKAKVLVAWVDEAENVSEEAWQKLLPTVREEGSEIWITWNPESPDSATHKRWRANPPDNCKSICVNWQDNPWFPEVLNQERLSDQKKRPGVYPHIWEGDFLQQREGALWTQSLIDKSKIQHGYEGGYSRIVVGVDPAVTASKTSDETGIIVAAKGTNGNFYILEDASGRFTPDQWASKAIALYQKHNADRIVAEVNQGGDLVQSLIKSIDRHVPVKSVRATRGKILRAEPIAALYEQGKVFHVKDFTELERQLVFFTGSNDFSPDRLDALVWALTDLTTSSGNVHWRIS